MKTGDELLLCDGQGTEYLARISGLTRTEVKADVVSQSNRAIATPRITLGQGLPKSDKMDVIVQKTTELGVASVVPLVTERTIVKIRDEARRILRWQKIAREAAMQSNRADIPSIEPILPFSDFLLSLDPGPLTHDPSVLKLLPWEEGTTHIRSVLRAAPDVKSIIVLIGPEGGFSKDEAASARDKGFHLVSLGRNILRTETAALAALSMIGYEYC
jgi:16S rRNA (uracil1498-N3)-methyltransferase